MELPPMILGFLVAHAVNSTEMEEGCCCPHECGPCQALWWLAAKDLLSDAIRPYAGTGRWAWWDYDADEFCLEYLRARWCSSADCSGIRTMAEEKGIPYEQAYNDWVKETLGD